MPMRSEVNSLAPHFTSCYLNRDQLCLSYYDGSPVFRFSHSQHINISTLLKARPDDRAFELYRAEAFLSTTRATLS